MSTAAPTYTAVATATTRNGATRVGIWATPGTHRGRPQTVYIVDFVHALHDIASRRSMTWGTYPTEAAARAAANSCYRRWNGTSMVVGG